MKSETLEETKKINRGADNEMIEDRDGEKTEKQDDGFNLKTEIFSWILTIGAAFLSALLIGGFIIFYAYVPSGSMENTLHAGNRLIGFRLAYINKDPQRGDIITFRYPLDESEIFIKRVIGLPGETLDIRDSHVYINGSETPLKEEYLKEEWEVANNELHYEIPEDCFFVMGDNRNNSADGRYWAEEAIAAGEAEDYEEAVDMEYCFVNRDQILGKAIFRYFPSFKIFPHVEYGYLPTHG